jgi:hypothetical protein
MGKILRNKELGDRVWIDSSPVASRLTTGLVVLVNTDISILTSLRGVAGRWARENSLWGEWVRRVREIFGNNILD